MHKHVFSNQKNYGSKKESPWLFLIFDVVVWLIQHTVCETIVGIDHTESYNVLTTIFMQAL